MAAASPGTIVEARALAYQAELYAKRAKWPQTVDRLCHLFDRFPGTDPGRKALLRASQVYRDQLDDATVADSLLDVLRASITEIEGAQEK